MKGKGYLITGLVSAMLIGWALGFLRLPYLERNDSFLLGFLSAVAFFSLGFLLLKTWNLNIRFRLTDKESTQSNGQSTKSHTYLLAILVSVLLLGTAWIGFILYQQQASFKQQIQNQEQKLEEMAASLEAAQKNELAPLMNNLLVEVAEELKQHPHRMLRDTTISRIAALCFAFKPYKYMEGDSLMAKAYSPERGQLLQALVLMQIDTGSFARIKRKTHFTSADLRGGDLKGLDLSGIDLQDANLKAADLSGANLKGADLGGVNLWGAILNQTNLSKANLKRADLSWAQLNEATLTGANLDGVTLMNAQLRKAVIKEATFQWARSVGALFNEADLSRVNFAGTDLTKANLSEANLSDANLRRINLSEAVLIGVKCQKAMVDEKWLDKVKEWRPSGATELQGSFSVVSDTVDLEKRPLFRLKKN